MNSLYLGQLAVAGFQHLELRWFNPNQDKAKAHAALPVDGPTIVNASRHLTECLLPRVKTPAPTATQGWREDSLPPSGVRRQGANGCIRRGAELELAAFQSRFPRKSHNLQRSTSAGPPRILASGLRKQEAPRDFFAPANPAMSQAKLRSRALKREAKRSGIFALGGASPFRLRAWRRRLSAACFRASPALRTGKAAPRPSRPGGQGAFRGGVACRACRHSS